MTRMAFGGIVLLSIGVLAQGLFAAETTRRDRAKARAKDARARREAKAAEAKERREEAKAKREAKAEELKARAEEAKTRRDAQVAELKEKREAVKANREEKVAEQRDKRQEAVENRVDNRQARQEKRIEHGISKGYLTDSEVARLQGQQSSIASLEESLKADGKLTRAEGKELRSALGEASRCIWAEKHDTDGNQMSVYRLGKNVKAKTELTDMMNREDLTRQEARAVVKDFHRTVTLKKKLATEDLNEAQRDKFQAEYDALLNKYFEIVE